MRFKRDNSSRTITVTGIPLHVDGLTTAGDTMTVKVSYEGDSSARVGHTLDHAVLPLMVAAPELLEALQILRVQIGDYRDGDGAAKFHACNIADAAIAKATGNE